MREPADHALTFTEDSPSTKPRRSRVRWVVLGVVSATYFLGAADRANLAVALPYISKEFHLSKAEGGALASIFFIGMTLIQIPGSLLIQKLRIRPVVIFSILLTSFTTLFTGMANSAAQLFASRAALGVGEGPLPVGCLSMLNRWFPPRERATAVGICVASFKLAPAVVPPVAAAIIYVWGWREMFYVFAVAGLIFAALWMFIAEEPRESKRTNDAERDYIETGNASPLENVLGAQADRPILDKLMRSRRLAVLASNRAILRNPSLWGCAIAYFLMAGVAYTILTWIPTYLVEVKKYNLMTMGFVSSAPWIGGVLGAIVGGALSDRFFAERRKPVMLITSGSAVFTTFALISAPNDPTSLGALLLATGFLLNIGYSTFQVYPMALATKERVPFAVAIISTMGALGAGVAPVVVGFIIDHGSWNAAFLYLSASAVGAFSLVGIIYEPLRELEADN